MTLSETPGFRKRCRETLRPPQQAFNTPLKSLRSLPQVGWTSRNLVFAIAVGYSAIQGFVLADAGLDGPRVISISGSGTVTARWQGQATRIEMGQSVGKWSLMGVVRGVPQSRLAVFEDFSQTNGHILFADKEGVKVDLPKSSEPTWADPKTLYRGHRLEEVFSSERDLLGEEILAKSGDPEYGEVAACCAPISKMYTWSFVGTHDCLEKVGVFYGGATPNFDPAAYVPEIKKIRDAGHVLDGLVGGWLPALRFAYPEKPGDWSELVIYAPMRVEDGNQRVQPVWYRICRVEGNTLRWVRYFDSYHPFPPRLEAKAASFYEELLNMRAGWEHALAQGMQINIPDQRLADQARHSLVREIITRMGAFPKYGVFDRGYGGSEHDGFPDTFTVDTAAMLAWGLSDLAGQYLDNYFGYFVRDDGSILYRGPETGQYGRMLTVAAQYADYTENYQLLLRHRRRLDAVAKLLLSLRSEALRLPPVAAAYGMIAGWSEADACLDPDPPRYMLPYFSNSTEAARGFEDLGAVWERIGAKRHLPELARWGQQLRQESRALAKDIQTAIARSMLTNTAPPCLPAIAGVTEPFHTAVVRDKLDPQFRSYRAYMEMLYSGNLTRDEVATIVNYRAAHHDIILGMPTVYGHDTHEWGGFLSYGHGYGLLQYDFTREYLLLLYSLMAHQYTRGTWTAPETRLVDPNRFAAPYCSPAQMTVPLLARWMLVFEEPGSEVVWLAKATPRSWLEDGKTIAVTNAPTRWGSLSFSLRSHLQAGNIEARLVWPSAPPSTLVKLRLRVPPGHRIGSVTANGENWEQFNAEDETVTLPPARKGQVELTIHY
jgi:hypothetical protein